MDKLKLHTPTITDENTTKIAALFPHCVTEGKIDFELLKQELSSSLIDGTQERYQLNWVGKREALLNANAPIAKTLRPCRDESVDFDTTENLYIEGDNLDALKLLQETYLNKVKMIYIDPPYNTGNDFIYEDDFAENTADYLQRSNQKDDAGNRLTTNSESNGRFHSDWLSMMYPRLKLARNLLRDDGVIFISIDDNEQANLKRLCDEVFGEDNFVGVVCWKNKYGAGAKTRTFIDVHEYILCYSKTPVSDIQSTLSNEQMLEYEKNKDDKYSYRGGYITQPLMTKSLDDRKYLQYEIIYCGETIKPRKQWVWSKERLEQAISNDEVVFKKMNDGTYSVRAKIYLKDENEIIRKGKPLSFISEPYNQEGTQEVEDCVDEKIFSFPKPLNLVKRFLEFTVNKLENKNDIILDFFSGSGSATTAHAVMQLNAEDGGKRKFIMVQLPEVCDEKSEAFKAGYKTIADIGKERIRRAGQKIKTDNGLTALDLDIGFRVLKIDSSNMNDVYYSPDAISKDDLHTFIENIKADRTDEDLLFQVLLDWGVDLSLPIERKTIDDKTVFIVANDAIVACFDRNGGVTETFIKELAKIKPLRAVFCDAGFASDSVKINVEQIFKMMSPSTDIKTI
ncbi:MAG: site-specific DNA-methyltransferase [Methylococcales bacterium]